MLKIACISDTHGRGGWSIPPCDVFIHAGDITAGGKYGDNALFASWLERQTQAKHKIIVPGNHDKHFQIDPQSARELYCFAHVLIDEEITIDGKTFYGSPWTPPFFNWFFMAEEDVLSEIYKRMPQDIDVLITHGPPKGILDPAQDGSHVGSNALLDAIKPRSIRHHIFGHLHAAGGKEFTYHPSVGMFYNVAAVDESYILRRGCKIIEI